jgi:C1A family cysteine protease
VFNAYDLALGVGSVSPAVIGVNWYSGMMQPDQNYQIHPTGTIVGGHAICVRGVNFKKKLFVLQNSWGAHWGANGCCLMSFANMDMLLKQNGDAVFTVNRNKKLLTF